MIGCYNETEKYTPGFLKAPRGVTSSEEVVALTRQHCNCLGDWKVRGRGWGVWGTHAL